MTKPPNYTPEPGWLADDVERAETRIAEWEGRTNVASEPMTLAEFEREAVERVRLAQQPDSTMRYERAEDIVRYGLRPMILRLIAGERQICGANLMARGHKEAADIIRKIGDPS